jgi:hypothetical protein
LFNTLKSDCFCGLLFLAANPASKPLKFKTSTHILGRVQKCLTDPCVVSKQAYKCVQKPVNHPGKNDFLTKLEINSKP